MFSYIGTIKALTLRFRFFFILFFWGKWVTIDSRLWQIQRKFSSDDVKCGWINSRSRLEAVIDSATKTVTDDNLVPTLTVVEHLHGVIVAWQRLIRLLTFILNIIFPRFSIVDKALRRTECSLRNRLKCKIRCNLLPVGKGEFLKSTQRCFIVDISSIHVSNYIQWAMQEFDRLEPALPSWDQ